MLSIAIGPQPLATALAEFAHQTGLQLVYVSDVLKDQQSKGSRARVSTAEALTALLDGTGLTFDFLNERAVRIFPQPKRTEKSADGPKPPLRARVPTDRLPNEVDIIGQRDVFVRAFESVQNIPTSVSLVSGEVLEAQKSEQLLDYAASVPGMNILTPGAPGQPQVIIRGIFPFSGGSAVAFYIDDTPIGPTGPYAYAGNLSLDLVPFDLERFEVWRGPQGTSIGAESEIGLLRYALIQPNLDDFHASAAADVFAIHGADNPGESIFGAVNLPIVKGQLAVRASGYDNYTPGYVDNLFNGAKGINVLRRDGWRVAALWRPTETFTARVNVLWKQDTAQSWSQVTFDQVATVPNTGEAYFVRQSGSWGDLLDNAPLLSPGSNRLELYSVSLNWTPGAIDVHSATAWSRINNYNASDQTQAFGSYYPEWSNGAVADGLALAEQYVSLSKFSEELHVSSSSGRHVEWMLGGFYTRESGSDDQYTQAYDTAYQPIEFFSPSINFSHQPSKFAEEVLFGNATWHVTGRLDLGAGIRFSHDEQSFTYTSGAWNSPRSSFFGSSSETATSWIASARYRFNPSAMVYGRVATGFQPGFPNGFYPGAPPTVSGETATNYELGLKAGNLESKALVDLSVFYVDWKDIQVGIAPDNVYYTANGAHATSRGLELTTSYAPIEGLQLGYNAAYTECALDSTIPAANYYLTGYQIPDVPKWTMSGTAAYSWPLAGLWRARLGTDFRWFGQQWNVPGAVQSQQPGNYPAVVIPSYWLIDANAHISRGPLTLRLFVRNLTDERASLNRFAILDAASVPTEIVNKLLQPRTVGMGVSYNF